MIAGLTEQVAWAGLRGLLLAVGLAAVAPRVAGAVRTRRWLWLVLLAPLFSPSLIVGFTYGGFCTISRFGEVAYTLLIGMRLLPLAVVVQLLLPPPTLGPAARHCAQLLGRPIKGVWLHGRLRNAGVVGGVVFLLAFQEFELASLCGVATWTVYLIDLQVGALSWIDSMAAVALPVGVELVVLGLVGGLVFAARAPHAEQPGAAGGGAASWWAVLATVVVVLVPLAVLAPGLVDLGTQLHVSAEIGNSAVLAAAAALCAAILVWACPPWLLVTLCLPGLLGGLVLGLSVHGVFQTALLAPLRDTPLPVIVGWTLALMPVGLVLRVARARLVPSAPVHAARLLARAPAAGVRQRGRDLVFAMIGQWRATVLAALFCLAFFEVLVGDLLAPSNMPPAAPRLYNMMHYGQSPGLAAMVLLMMATAMLGAVLVLLGTRLYGRTRWHVV